MSDAASLLSKLSATERSKRTLRATVSAYREDGLVNLRYGTARMYGIPCLGSYTNRAVGDVVEVENLGNNAWVVLGVIGGTDPAWVGPTTQNTGYQLYAADTLISRGRTDPGYEGYVGSSRADGARPVMLAWSYYNGSTNALTTGVSGKTSLTVTVARSNFLHGQRDAVQLQLCPHNFDTLPTTIVLDTASFSPVTFWLETGEIRNLKLPSDWFTAIAAGTPAIKGFGVLPTTVTPADAGYAIFSAISGGFRAV